MSTKIYYTTVEENKINSLEDILIEDYIKRSCISKDYTLCKNCTDKNDNCRLKVKTKINEDSRQIEEYYKLQVGEVLGRCKINYKEEEFKIIIFKN
jgi:hypothetical protein